MGKLLYVQFRKLPLVLRFFLIACITMFLFGVMIHLIEPENFPSIFDGIWWAIVTASTVGFGDYIPKTVPGRILGMLLIFIGASLLTIYFANLTTEAVTRHNEFLEGKRVYKGMGHLIIIGWNERSRDVISSISKQTANAEIVLIDETLEARPRKLDNVHFIKGRPNSDDTLFQANVAESIGVVITADQNKDELQADMHTILTLLAIKGINPAVKCIAEILTTDQVSNARRAGADKIIQANMLLSSVMLKSIFSPAIAVSLKKLINIRDNWLESIQITDELIGTSFTEASKDVFFHNKIVIGVIRGEDTYINPPHDFQLQKEDHLLIISEALII
ncbi:potassium channel protein [Bacillus sp. DNRA2]|uniref:potassium channel family protein n=1 Tax=Bacillus sp. DNRA2 TaxID=2723053 RepID=UPI00145EFD7B|nr:potassium channel family protein [Bacillus sp. DNRA2]NMD69049.1 potassium channel protein [Bacillus sp. DNRA2]